MVSCGRGAKAANIARFRIADRTSDPKKRRNNRKPSDPKKVSTDSRNVAGQYVELALAALASVPADEGAPAAARVAAARAILDRADGKTTQPKVSTPQPITINLDEKDSRA